MSFSYCESVQLDVGAAIEFHSPHHRLHRLVHAGDRGERQTHKGLRWQEYTQCLVHAGGGDRGERQTHKGLRWQEYTQCLVHAGGGQGRETNTQRVEMAGIHTMPGACWGGTGERDKHTKG